MADPAAYPGPQFWEDVRREFARTGLSSVVVTGYRWASDVVELIDLEVVTWDHPVIDPG